jgi:hypothetical protein
MMAREASPKALRTLIKVMDDERAPHGVRCTAAAHILDRAWGRAPQQNTLTINHNMRIAQLTDEQLIAIIGGAAPDLVLGGSAVNTPLIEAEASEG